MLFHYKCMVYQKSCICVVLNITVCLLWLSPLVSEWICYSLKICSWRHWETERGSTVKYRYLLLFLKTLRLQSPRSVVEITVQHGGGHFWIWSFHCPWIKWRKFLHSLFAIYYSKVVVLTKILILYIKINSPHNSKKKKCMLWISTYY